MSVADVLLRVGCAVIIEINGTIWCASCCVHALILCWILQSLPKKQNIWAKRRNYSSQKSCRKLIYIFSFKPTQMIEALIERGRFTPLSLSILKHYRYKFHSAPKIHWISLKAADTNAWDTLIKWNPRDLQALPTFTPDRKRVTGTLTCVLSSFWSPVFFFFWICANTFPQEGKGGETEGAGCTVLCLEL